MGHTNSDAEAIRRAGDHPEAFEQVFERRFDAVHGYLRRRVGRDLADELAAETFTRAFAHRRRFVASHDSALPWLLGIASNLIAEQRRAEQRRLAALARAAGAQSAAAQASPGDGQLDGRLAEALATLPARDRDALLLLAWGELSYEEVAVALAIPLGTVRSRINRARRRLTAALDTPLAATARPGAHHA
ncbi:RNA polymerase sigma factor [Conexibacter stalactiti]|uniref:RNA polymerase sigma factor n=1 Tax=Conexibacter stalactiti TaxID=1940611 RepID=A0ABU4HS70_9ACTN|nr:RNA polymerase sigma factor [Conexibacter stalactiti]MDW5596172.1 RNA polymerase sigma factor [Conexibacter stalactiti]MEC5036814.1 RNA polymerase sigma factor [Conexibacter stalactiti]